MSHQPERKEKDCLNCGTEVIGRYCHVCGQENIVTHQSFSALSKHFVYDIFHFDGNFFYTLKYLFTRPGLVAKEYVKGRRKQYLDPIRMYLFTSAVFFIVFFAISESSGLTINNSDDRELTSAKRKQKIEQYKEKMKEDPEDSVKYRKRIALLEDTSGTVTYADLYRIAGDSTYNINGRDYKNLRDYDSIQKTLPPKDRDGWFMRMVSKRSLVISQKYKGDGGAIARGVWNSFMHQLPYLLFISLPFFAAILKMLYVRRKEFYYSDHAVFTLYHYIFSFLLLLVIFAMNGLSDWTGWEVFDVIFGLLFLVWPVYLWIEMKRFYGQSRGKTFVKFLLLNMLGFLVLLILLTLFFLLSLFQM